MYVVDGKYGGKELFTFEDIFNSTFMPKTFDVQWIRLSGQCDIYTVSHKRGTLFILAITCLILTNFNNSFTIAFVDELQKSWIKIYHIASNLLPYFLAKIEPYMILAGITYSSDINFVLGR